MRDDSEIRAKIGEDVERRDERVPSLAKKRKELAESSERIAREGSDLKEKAKDLSSDELLERAVEMMNLATNHIKIQEEFFYGELIHAAIGLGKLGGMYYCLGSENNEIIETLSDPYWLGEPTERPGDSSS